MGRHAPPPQHPRCGQHTGSRLPPSARICRSVPVINRQQRPAGSGDDTARPHRDLRPPTAASPQPTPAQIRNPHSPRPVTRGFVPRRLSYACRRPKLFTVADRRLSECLSAVHRCTDIRPASQSTQRLGHEQAEGIFTFNMSPSQSRTSIGTPWASSIWNSVLRLVIMASNHSRPSQAPPALSSNSARAITCWFATRIEPCDAASPRD